MGRSDLHSAVRSKDSCMQRSCKKGRAKSKSRLDGRSIKVSITDKNSLRVPDSLLFLFLRIVAEIGGIVLPAAFEGRGQLAGRTVFAEQNLRERRPPSCPGYQAWSRLATRSIQSFISTLPPAVSTTIVFLFTSLIW